MNLLKMERVLALIAEERHRQDRKWGDQNHPNVHPRSVEGGRGTRERRAAQFYGIPTAHEAKMWTENAARAGECTWADILIEEVAEVLDAAVFHAQNPNAYLNPELTLAALRRELIQVAAVAVQWAEKLDEE